MAELESLEGVESLTGWKVSLDWAECLASRVLGWLAELESLDEMKSLAGWKVWIRVTAWTGWLAGKFE